MSNKETLVVVFLRGGADGLNLVGPSADPNYQQARRPDTRVERDGDHPGLVLDAGLADVDFRLHSRAQALKRLYDTKELAIVHACGLTNGTRSHFEAIDYMERGTPDNKNTSSGWLARLMENSGQEDVLPIVAAANTLPVSLLGAARAVAVPATRKMVLGGNEHFRPARDALLRARYAGKTSVTMNGKACLAVLDTFDHHLPKVQGKVADYVPATNAHYPNEGYAGEISNGLKTVAQLMKMDIGVQVATVDYGGWDTHIGQGGRFPNLVDGLSRSIEAFWNDIEKWRDKTTLIVMSEFGRRLKGNESGGTDHGHGNVMLVLGGRVKGGKMYGTWPGLTNEKLDNQVDLAITTDYRSVLAEVVTKRFGNPALKTVFPGLRYEPLNILVA